MKQITGIKKLKKAIEVTFDEDLVVVVEPELVIKYHLNVGNTLDEATFLSFDNENMYLSTLRFALSKLKKMLTVKELKDILSTRDVPISIQRRVLNHAIERKYLDDLAYAKMYLSLRQYQEGPQMMKHRLKEKGISDAIIQMIFADYLEKDIVESLVKSKLTSMKKKTKKQAFQTIKMQLIAKGFDHDVIDRSLHFNVEQYQGDERMLLEKAYQKIQHTYQSKLSGYELEQKIKEKLYQKGFSYDMIKAYLEEIELQSW
jgi:regulatory protein